MSGYTGVTFQDTLDANLPLDGSPINTSPVGFDDTYTATGNIPISPATNLLANDIDPDSNSNGGLTVTQVQALGQM